MQFDLIGVGVSHLGDLLPLHHRLTFFHGDGTVMGVDTEKNLVVFDGPFFNITPQ